MSQSRWPSFCYKNNSGQDVKPSTPQILPQTEQVLTPSTSGASGWCPSAAGEREARETGGSALWQGARRHRSWRRARSRDLWRRVSCHVCATSAATRNRYIQLGAIIYGAKTCYFGAIDHGADSLSPKTLFVLSGV